MTKKIVNDLTRKAGFSSTAEWITTELGIYQPKKSGVMPRKDTKVRSQVFVIAQNLNITYKKDCSARQWDSFVRKCVTQIRQLAQAKTKFVLWEKDNARYPEIKIALDEFIEQSLRRRRKHAQENDTGNGKWKRIRVEESDDANGK